jgi:hypothetical protein
MITLAGFLWHGGARPGTAGDFSRPSGGSRDTGGAYQWELLRNFGFETGSIVTRGMNDS